MVSDTHDFSAIHKRLADIVGPQYVTDKPFVLRSYARDFGTMPPSVPNLVVRPKTTEEVVQIVKVANEFKVPIVPRGGGSAQEAGSTPPPSGGITIEMLRMNEILDIDEANGTVTCQAGITYVSLMNTLEKRGWKIGIAPSGAMAGTPGAHISRPGVGWGNIKYISSGDQTLGLKMVLPNGDVVCTGSSANPHSDVFFRYGLGSDLTGLFIGAEGAFGIMTECTLRIFPFPEKFFLEVYKTTDLDSAVSLFRDLAINNLVCYVSVPVIKPGELIIFHYNVEGDAADVDYRVAKIRDMIAKHTDMECLGTEGVQKFWNDRWFLTGEEFKDGIAGAVNYFLPFDKLVNATWEMKQIMDRHQIKVYVQQMFPEPHGSEHVSLMFHHPDDMEERAKVWAAMQEMMDRALELGGAPYSKGRQWAPYLRKHMQDTGYWRLQKAIKDLLDPNYIMNPGVIGL
jgi:glycolate oxidase